jgi:hypothetical protein
MKKPYESEFGIERHVLKALSNDKGLEVHYDVRESHFKQSDGLKPCHVRTRQTDELIFAASARPRGVGDLRKIAEE